MHELGNITTVICWKVLFHVHDECLCLSLVPQYLGMSPRHYSQQTQPDLRVWTNDVMFTQLDFASWMFIMATSSRFGAAACSSVVKVTSLFVVTWCQLFEYWRVLCSSLRRLLRCAWNLVSVIVLCIGGGCNICGVYASRVCSCSCSCCFSVYISVDTYSHCGWGEIHYLLFIIAGTSSSDRCSIGEFSAFETMHAW